MANTRTLPEIAFVRVLTPGGPYDVGAILSVAFVSPDVGRLAAHDGKVQHETDVDRENVIPETISGCVVRAAGPYAAGAQLTLSFLDPTIARIHETAPDGKRERNDGDGLMDRRKLLEPRTNASIIERPVNVGEVETRRPAVTLEVVTADVPPVPIQSISRETVASLLIASHVVAPPRATDPTSRSKHGARLRLDWNRDRVRRFVQVVDKLFAVDRLGWYRHAFAMRLLVPDVVDCGDSQTDVEALRHLHALRAASIETLGRPLLAAFMPNFTVTADWLDSLDKPAAARALSGLREALLPFAGDDVIEPSECEPSWTIASIQKREIQDAPASSVEALLPLFIPYTSAMPELTETLAAYRSTLIDIFGRTAQPADAVRLNQMTEPNRALDDRLLQLSHAVSEAFGGLVVA